MDCCRPTADCRADRRRSLKINRLGARAGPAGPRHAVGQLALVARATPARQPYAVAATLVLVCVQPLVPALVYDLAAGTTPAPAPQPQADLASNRFLLLEPAQLSGDCFFTTGARLA